MSETADPMLNHKCRKIARVRNMAPGRELWMGELTEKIPGHPEETHCLHITTPYKSVIWGCNLGDMMAYAVLAQIAHEDLTGHEGPINPNWLAHMSEYYRAASREENEESLVD